MITADINYALDVDGRARFDIVDFEKNNVRFEPAKATVRDARPMNDELDLDVHGFRLYQHASSIATTGTKPELETIYLDEMSAFIKGITGAMQVRPQRSGMVLRNGGAAPRPGNYAPATFAHLDFTARTRDAFLNLSVEDDGPIEPYARMAVYQAWRAISPPPQDSLLAVADPRTVPESDLFVMDSVLGPEEFPSCFFESRLSRVNPDHAWYYFPNMNADEVLVFKGFDSDPNRCTGVMHTAFTDPTAPADAVPRESIEARFIAFFD